MLNKSSCKGLFSRHAELDSASSTHVVAKQNNNNQSGRSRIKYGMTPSGMGFTLIELLVVVLIIGILASIAVPQYQKAVDKAEMAGVLATFSSIRQSMERYRLANGAWPTSLDELDITIPKSKWIFVLGLTTGAESCMWPQPNGQPRGWASIRADRGNISGTGYGAVFYSIPGRTAYAFKPGVFCCVMGTGKNMERIKRMCNAIKESGGDAGSCYTGSKISVRLDK